MSDNHVVLLDNALAAAQAARSAPLADDVAFELFAAEQVLKSYELSPDETEAGRIGGSNDGALDGVYIFLGERLLSEDDDIFEDSTSPSSYARGQELRLCLIQAKTSPSFGETPIDLAHSSLSRLLDLTRDEQELSELYSVEVIQRVRMFTDAWQKLATRKPRVKIRFVYCTKGDTGQINSKVSTKASELESFIKKQVPGSIVNTEFLGAAELWKRYEETPSYTLQLPFLENATSGGSHVAIVLLRDYFNFITDDSGSILRHIFDWNVRDYQGNVEVNREIRSSVLDAAAPEFWWMNNGVTVVCSTVTINSKTYVLDDVQIVNGLQTSYTLYDALRLEKEEPAWDKKLLVRILATKDPEVRDKVIRATNRQTSVPVASLRATDDIQRSIESHFRANSWFYDRRKNYYRNMGEPAERIISIPLLAQAVMAMGFSEAHNSRARPSSLLKKEDDYQRLFSTKTALPNYLWIAKTQKKVDAYLTSKTSGASSSEKTNLRFYVSMVLATRAHSGRVYSPAQLTSLASQDLEFGEPAMAIALNEVRALATSYCDAMGRTLDRAAKTRDFVDYVLNALFPIT